MSLLLLVAISWVFFAVVGQGFLGSFNLYSLSQTVAIDAVVGFSQLVMMATGRMNLAVNGIGVAAVMLAGNLMAHNSGFVVPALIIGLLVGVAAGWLMGWIELRTRLSSFIVSLARLSVYLGITLVLTHGKEVSTLPPSIGDFGSNELAIPQLSPLIAVTLIVGIVLMILYRRSSIGWKMLAVGGNEQAARLSGIKVTRVVTLTYILSGLLAAVAGLMTMSHDSSALPSLGASWLLISFIGPVLGGVALTGGEVSVFGAFLGILFYDGITSGLVILHVSTYYLGLAQGVILLAAVLADQARRRHGHSSKRATGSVA